MRPAENIKRLIKNASVNSTPEVNQAVLADLLNELEKRKSTRSAAGRPNTWRIIMKSKITKLATAAAIILIVVLGITLLDKSTVPVYAIEQTIEALNSVTSVHIVARGWDNELMDMWIKINPETGKADYSYLKTPFIYNGRTFEFVIVSTPEVSYQYNETENVVKVFQRQLIQTGIEFDRILESIVEKLDENQRMEVYHGKDPQSGNNVIVLLVQSEDKLSKFLLDPETKLPISIENFGPQKTDLKRTERITYNQAVPERVLNFQIPEDTKVINISDIEEKLDRPDAGIPVDNLTKKQASVLIAREYWLALINKDWSRVEKLRPIHSAQEWSEIKSANPPLELLEVGQAYWQKGCSQPVTPCIVKYKDGRIYEIKTYPRFREINGQRSCVIGGLYAQSREITLGQQ